MTTTTGAALARDKAVHKVAATRCRRASECNHLGAGQMYADKDDCIDRETDAAKLVVAACASGIDNVRLDKCLGDLDNQFCEANMGPVAAMPECKSYCASP